MLHKDLECIQRLRALKYIYINMQKNDSVVLFFNLHLGEGKQPHQDGGDIMVAAGHIQSSGKHCPPTVSMFEHQASKT